MIEHKQVNWKTQDGTGIYAQYWKPEGDIKAVICQVHGLGEHSGRYAHVAEYLCEAGYAFLGFDHVGHGKSGGKKGHINSYEVLMESVDLLLDQASRLFPDSPQYLYGHSWGGNITANYLIRNQPKVKGAIISSPWLRLTKPPSGFMVGLAKLISKIAPAFPNGNGLKIKDLSHDPQVQEAYSSDPYVHNKISPVNFLETREAGEYAIEHASKISVPVFLFHGTEDRICSPHASKEFAENAGNGIDLKFYEGLFHECHNELEKTEVLENMKNWLEAH